MERERGHLSIIRNDEEHHDEGSPPLMMPRAIDESKAQSEIDTFWAGIRKTWTRILSPLEPRQADVMWGFLQLESVEEIAERMGIPVDEVLTLRVSAEEKIGGRLPF